MEKIVYSVQEAAKLIGISSSKMYELIRNDEVPHLNVGKRVVIPKHRFNEWVDTKVVGG